MKRKLLSYLMVVLAFVLTAAFYLWFDLEGIMWFAYDQPVVTADQVKKDNKKDFTGKKAGKGIREIKTLKAWKKLAGGNGYVTITPKDIEKTGVYTLGKWVDNRGTGKKKTEKKKPEAICPAADYTSEYTPLYVITLQDDNKILAQMNRGIAGRIARGKEVQLPVGRKENVSKEAKKMLQKKYKNENFSVSQVFYTIDLTWAKKNADAIFFGKIGITIFAFIFIAIFLQVVERALAKSLFKPDRKAALQEKVDNLSEKDEDMAEKEEETADGKSI